MPEFGENHRLLSARHSDTEPPAGGVDPDDGQVATWSAADKAWIAKDAVPGPVDPSDLGWHGSLIRVKLLPSDFGPTHIYYNVRLNTTGSYGWPYGAYGGVATVSIPQGFRAVAFKVYGLPAGETITAYLCAIDDDSSALLVSGDINVEHSFSPVEATETNYISILTSVDVVRIYGGYITIEPIPE